MGAQIFAVLLQSPILLGLALHGGDYEFHRVWEVPLASSSQLMYASRHVVCCLPVPYPSSWADDVQEGEAQVDGILISCDVSAYSGNRLSVTCLGIDAGFGYLRPVEPFA